jgi:hypothetical protein
VRGHGSCAAGGYRSEFSPGVEGQFKARGPLSASEWRPIAQLDTQHNVAPGVDRVDEQLVLKGASRSRYRPAAGRALEVREVLDEVPEAVVGVIRLHNERCLVDGAPGGASAVV